MDYVYSIGITSCILKGLIQCDCEVQEVRDSPAVDRNIKHEVFFNPFCITFFRKVNAVNLTDVPWRSSLSFMNPHTQTGGLLKWILMEKMSGLVKRIIHLNVSGRATHCSLLLLHPEADAVSLLSSLGSPECSVTAGDSFPPWASLSKAMSLSPVYLTCIAPHS